MSFFILFFGAVGLILFFIFCDLLKGFTYFLAYAILIGLFAGGAYALTERNIGAETLEHDDGLSIRQDSSETVGRKSLFIYYNTNRSHMGGGMRAGK